VRWSRLFRPGEQRGAPTTYEAYTGVRRDVVTLIPPGVRDVVDVGCSSGALGSVLESDGVRVTGIELDRALAAEAREKLTRVLEGDAAPMLITLRDRGEMFDCIVLADVLEHMAAPEATLSVATELLRRQGTIVVSLPNVRFYTTVVSLVFRGRWPRESRGVHDRTHLRWFTDRDARMLFSAHGLQVDRAKYNYRVRDNPNARINRLGRILALVPGRDFFRYQMLYRLVKQS